MISEPNAERVSVRVRVRGDLYLNMHILQMSGM